MLLGACAGADTGAEGFIEVNGETIEPSRTDEELVSLVSAWPSRRAVVRMGPATPYRCVARLTYGFSAPASHCGLG